MTSRPPRKSIPTEKRREIDAAQKEKKRKASESEYRKALREHQQDEAEAGYRKLPSFELESEDDDYHSDHHTSSFRSHPVVTSTSKRMSSVARNGEIVPRGPLQRSSNTAPFAPRPSSEVVRRSSSQCLDHDYIGDRALGHSGSWSHRSSPPPLSSSPPPLSSPSPFARSSSPIPFSTSSKRKDAPASSPGPVVLKKVKVPEPGGTRGRHRTSDFTGAEKLVLMDAQTLFRVVVATQDAYPDISGRRDELATDSWIKASMKRQLQLELIPAVSLLITKRASQMRGEVKAIARSVVESQYGISEDLTKYQIREYSYIYKDPAKRAGMYRHPSIQKIINKTWFSKSTDEGPTYAEFSDDGHGLPLATIALTLTSIHCALEEWVTGERKDLEFRGSVYREHYVKHLDQLKRLEEHTQEEQIVPRLRCHWIKMARKHAKVAEPSTTSDTTLTTHDLEAAKAEWKDLQLDEDEE